jgi:hypothetical protein
MLQAEGLVILILAAVISGPGVAREILFADSPLEGTGF